MHHQYYTHLTKGTVPKIPIFTNNSTSEFFTQPILQDGYVSTLPCLCVCLSLTHFPNPPASLEEDEEKEIYCSSRGEGQFISDL